ncbi:AMMECR1 containing protein [Desulfovibrio sp. X2]|uniref:AmmeMemoRadiSam system protein A n=1 Tax=Desulfovibrio sp. X2 TaxID=941449 RepID=UPI000358A6EE|nr:AmmeMemoRadiSam system protein A [Desulfovibrio sp. X2]EPR43868.1 AMMECR1 containing protein [Desulfovibrio sp. X2]
MAEPTSSQPLGPEPFRFVLTDEEKSYLKALVRQSIKDGFAGGGRPGKPPTEKLTSELGAFVTLKENGGLRGCIGHIIGDKPVYETVYEMAQQAAFRDPRFPPVQPGEFDSLEIEVSILSPITPCPDLRQIAPGRHGLLVLRPPRSGLLLPQVASEYGWDCETFLAQTCLKAGLPPDAWKEPGTDVYWFEAEVF